MITTLSTQEWLQQLPDFDAAVCNEPDISTVCSGSDWQIAALETLHTPRESAIFRRDDCWLVGCLGTLQPFSIAFQPHEISWAFGCPLLGPSPYESSSFLLDILDQQRHWQLAFLSGIPRHSALHRTLTQQLRAHYHIEIFEGAHCMQGEIDRDPEAYLSKRGKKFRANLRRSSRRAKEQGISFEWHNQDIDTEAIFQRIMDVEMRSWKYASGGSIFLTERFDRFYRNIAHRMAQNGRLRVLFATRDGNDLAYVFGGVMGHVYRGFQLSYDEEWASHSLGHLVQWELIQQLAQHDHIHTYDLGMAMEYKEKWSDNLLEIDNFVIFL
jgi:hypothetical protein